MRVIFNKDYKLNKCVENKDINDYIINFEWSATEEGTVNTGYMPIIACNQLEAFETLLQELSKQKFLKEIYLHNVIINQNLPL